MYIYMCIYIYVYRYVYIYIRASQKNPSPIRWFVHRPSTAHRSASLSFHDDAIPRSWMKHVGSNVRCVRFLFTIIFTNSI